MYSSFFDCHLPFCLQSRPPPPPLNTEHKKRRLFLVALMNRSTLWFGQSGIQIALFLLWAFMSTFFMRESGLASEAMPNYSYVNSRSHNADVLWLYLSQHGVYPEAELQLTRICIYIRWIIYWIWCKCKCLYFLLSEFRCHQTHMGDITYL